MKTAKILNNKHGQIVQLPQEFYLEGKEVFVKRMGNVVVLIPKKNSWDSLINSLSHFSPDFMQERNQPKEQQKREYS